MEKQLYIKHTYTTYPKEDVFNHFTAVRYFHFVPTKPLAVLFNASDPTSRQHLLCY